MRNAKKIFLFVTPTTIIAHILLIVLLIFTKVGKIPDLFVLFQDDVFPNYHNEKYV